MSNGYLKRLQEAADIVKKQRNKGLGKLAMQKSVSEDEFEVEPREAAKLHKDLAKEHLDKMNKFDGVITGFKKKMEGLDPNSPEYKHYHSVCAVNEVEKERHRQHAKSHIQCIHKHTKLADLYDSGIPGDNQIAQIVHKKTVAK